MILDKTLCKFFKGETKNSTSPTISIYQFAEDFNQAMPHQVFMVGYLVNSGINVQYCPIPDNQSQNWYQIEQMDIPYKYFPYFNPENVNNVKESILVNFTPCFLSTDESLIFSTAPNSTIVTSLQIFDMEYKVAFLILCTCLIIAPFLLHFDWSNLGSKPKKKVPILLRKYKRAAWEAFCVFFTEPLMKPPKHTPGRIVFGAWLIGVSIIYLQLSCHMKGELSSTNFDTVEIIEDVIPESEFEPMVFYYTYERYFLEAWVKDHVYMGNVYFNDVKLIGDSEDIDVVKYMNEKLASYFSSMEFFHINLETFFVQYDGISKWKYSQTVQISHSSYRKALMYIPISYKVDKSTPDGLRTFETILRSIMLPFETKVLEHHLFKKDYMVELLRWSKPEPSVSKLSFSNSYSAFIIWVYGISFSTVICTFNTVYRSYYYLSNTKHR